MLSEDWHGDNHIVKIVLHGFQGQATVKGQQYNNVMAPWGKVLKDDQVAAVLTYVRNEWGNKASPINKDFVAKIREQNKDRTEAWTQKELQAIGRVLVREAAAATPTTGATPAPAGAAPTPAAPPLPQEQLPRPRQPQGHENEFESRTPREHLSQCCWQLDEKRGFRRIGNEIAFLPLFFPPAAARLFERFAQPRSGNLYWAPPNYTTGGEQIDSILNFIFWLTLFVFIAVQVVFLVYLVKYRRRPGQPAHYSHGNNLLEVIWTTIPTLIFLGLSIYSNRRLGRAA